mmetsp:Transcript_26250/g.65980  ORF Transcript_26250/g.65980 Transcript_26250/m.65980 type:complete len:195 (+) Transcript_26250:126-710(+)
MGNKESTMPKLSKKQAEQRLDKADLDKLKNEWKQTTGMDAPKGEVSDIDTFAKIFDFDLKDEEQQDLARRFFKAFDVNGNGSLSYKEYISAAAVVDKGSRDEKIALLFSVWDEDGDGCLTRDELRNIAAIYASPSMADKFVDDIFKSDTNADGEISLKEFKHWLENSKSEMAAGLQDMFDDGSGAPPPAAASAK